MLLRRPLDEAACERIVFVAGVRQIGWLERPVAVDRHAVHHPPLALVVVDRIVLHAPIVPKRDRTLFPAEAAGKFRPDGVLPQEIQQRPAFLDRHVLEANSEVAVDVEPSGSQPSPDGGLLQGVTIWSRIFLGTPAGTAPDGKLGIANKCPDRAEKASPSR